MHFKTPSSKLHLRFPRNHRKHAEFIHSRFLWNLLPPSPAPVPALRTIYFLSTRLAQVPGGAAAEQTEPGLREHTVSRGRGTLQSVDGGTHDKC